MDFKQVLESLSIDYREGGEHHHVTANWVGFDCPFCSPNSGRYRMGYKGYTGYVNCWSCGSHPLLDSLKEISGRPYDELRTLLSDTLPKKKEAVKRGRLVLPPGCGKLLDPHKDYLRERGFSVKKLVKLWDLRGVGVTPPLNWRIVIPVYSNGSMVSWTTRTIGKSEPRYMNAKPNQEIVSAKTLLFGEDYCRHCVIVTEGPFDAMRIGPGAVATMGMSYSKQQVSRISKYPVRVVCFDKEATERSRCLSDELSVFPGTTYRVELDSKDPGSATKAEINHLRKEFLS